MLGPGERPEDKGKTAAASLEFGVQESTGYPKHGCDTCPHGPEQAEMQCSLAVTMAVGEWPEDSSRR